MKSMKSHMGIWTLLVLLVFGTSCKKHVFGISGKGVTESEIRLIQGFNRIDLDIDALVEVKQASEYYVEVFAQGNLLSHLTTNVSNQKLTISFDTWVRKHDDIKIIIHAPDISELEISGSGQIQVVNILNTNELKTNISGSGKIVIQELIATKMQSSISGSGKVEVLAGTIQETIHKISGSGDVKMHQASAVSSDVSISGSGKLELHCTDQLKVRISGSGSVYYSGEPSIDVDISGSGKLIKL